jgi:ATP-dependent Clp protease ATP-binding subunit ClpB
MAYDPNEFSEQANKVIATALKLAQENNHIAITPTHLAFAIADDEQSILMQICNKLQPPVNIEDIRNALRKLMKQKNTAQQPPPVNLGASQSLLKILNKATDLRKKQGDSHVTVDALLIALFDDSDVNTVLSSFGLTKSKVQTIVKKLRGNSKVTSATAEQNYEALEKYGMDLVKQAEDGKLDPVIGRDAEIRRCIQVLSRRTKNNPVCN